ncbi:MAG: DUF3307 domain-containing protein [Chloroflexota bacterium]|nr:DUF3307 domain-containing protein [Chloroflexota bacterium]
MLYAIILAHLLGDYLFQWGFIARWKARSLMGVLAHGGIVTVVTLACASLVDPAWWPYAALIGLTHTAIDLVRARFLRAPDPSWELAWYLLDQLAHLVVILLVVAWSDSRIIPISQDQYVSAQNPYSVLHREKNSLAGFGPFQKLFLSRQIANLSYIQLVEKTHSAPSRPAPVAVTRLLTDSRALVYAIGYLLLLNPAWVFVRFTVRGVWGSTAAPHLGQGEKYGPMVERVLIASLVLAGQAYLIPVTLLPRRVASVSIQGGDVGVLIRPATGHWAETILSVSLAVMVGLVLRAATAGG